MTKSGEQQLNEHKNGGSCYANLGFSAKIPYRSPEPISHQLRHDRGHANMIRGLCNKRPKAANSLLATLNLCILFKPSLQPLKSQQIKGIAVRYFFSPWSSTEIAENGRWKSGRYLSKLQQIAGVDMQTLALRVL